MKVKLRYRQIGILELIADYVRENLVQQIEDSMQSKSSFRQLTQITK
jgi:hypothetical protein